MADVTKLPYAAWLEESIRTMSKLDVRSACIVVADKDSNTLTAYYKADAQDKAIFAHNIQSDITMDLIRLNADVVKKAIEELEGGADECMCREVDGGVLALRVYPHEKGDAATVYGAAQQRRAPAHGLYVHRLLGVLSGHQRTARSVLKGGMGHDR